MCQERFMSDRITTQNEVYAHDLIQTSLPDYQYFPTIDGEKDTG